MPSGLHRNGKLVGVLREEHGRPLAETVFARAHPSLVYRHTPT